MIVNTATPKVSSVMAKVLETTEVLEHILSFLLLKDIVKKQRVCKSWKVVIETSPTLRRLCFLDPDGREIKYLSEVYPHFWSVSLLSSFSLIESAEEWDVRKPHPLFEHMFKNHIPGRDYHGSLTKADEVMRMLSCPKGSWEQAFLTQPPIEKVTLYVARKHPAQAQNDLNLNYGRSEYNVEATDGSRLGRLVHEFYKGIYCDGPVPPRATPGGYWPWTRDLIGFREVRGGNETFSV